MADDGKTCPKCDGRPKNLFNDKYCEKHHVCVDCGIAGSELKESPWYTSRGVFQCRSCEEFERKTRIECRKSFGFSHRYTDEVVCPHCGYEHRDSWEWGEGEHECSDCEKTFIVNRDVQVTYTTEKK